MLNILTIHILKQHLEMNFINNLKTFNKRYTLVVSLVYFREEIIFTRGKVQFQMNFQY